MTHDPTEAARRAMIESGQPHIDLAHATQRWTTEQLTAEFTVEAFFAPFAIVRRKSDGKSGVVEFTHHPRFYFNFTEDEP